MARRPRKPGAKRPVRRRSTQSARQRPAVPRPSRRFHNLPTQLTTFIGRKQEIAEVKHLLSTTRLLTLTGSGGCGKTRLALRVAAETLRQYSDGVWFVDLAPLADPAFVPNSVAAALNLPERPNRPLLDTLANYLRTKKLLLLIDNCEHLRAACQDLTKHLLRASATIRVLTTSREGLGVEGEMMYRVPSLRLPDARQTSRVAELTRCDAIRLFIERAAHVQLGFSLTERNAPVVVQICRRLDGLALAIEFAAARVMVLSVEQIAARLDDRFRLLTAGTTKTLDRQQTLRAALDWSYDLLTEAERALLRRLSVFAGGWTLEAAEAICSGDGIESTDVLRLLSQLVGKSLVVADTREEEARYSLPETVRQYAQHKLVDEGAADRMRRAHRDWYLAFAEQTAPHTRWPGAGRRWLDRLEMEHSNLRVALEWSQGEKGGAEAALRFVGSLHWLWFERDYWSEGMTRARAALARSDEAPLAVLPGALLVAMHFAWQGGDDRLAVTFGEKCLAVCHDLGADKRDEALLFHYGLASNFLGVLAMRQGEYKRAQALFDESSKVAQILADTNLHGLNLLQSGTLARYQGDDERSVALLTESLTVLREGGDKRVVGAALHRFGRDVAFHRGDYHQAAESFRESLLLSFEVDSRYTIANCLEDSASLVSAMGQSECAARLFGAAEAQREIVGRWFAPPEQTEHNRWVIPARAALGEAAFTRLWGEGRAMTLEQAVEYALTVALTVKESTPRSGKKLITSTDGTRAALLARREQQVAALVAEGKTNKEIATSLSITTSTAATHVNHILNKLGVNSRVQIAAWAVVHGLGPGSASGTPIDGTE